MRNTSQRVQAALQGAKKIKQKRRQRSIQIILTGVSLCLVLLISTLLPTLAPTLGEPQSTSTTDFAASIFVGSPALPYILVGLLSFALGILFTLLCVLTRKKGRELGDDD